MTRIHRQLYKVTCRLDTREHVFLVTSADDRSALAAVQSERPELARGFWGAVPAQDDIVLLYVFDHATAEISEERPGPRFVRDRMHAWYRIARVDAVQAAAALEETAELNRSSGVPKDGDDAVTARARQICRDLATTLERVVAVLRGCRADEDTSEGR
jgi:hypothetical protein